MIEIPYAELSETALLGIVDEFITRDSSVLDGSLNDKRASIVRALESSGAIITFDPISGSTDIVDKR